VAAGGGELGALRDGYFDDQERTLRYLAIETGNWLTGRRVLLATLGVVRVDEAARQIHVNADRARVQDAPVVEWERPITRGYESAFAGYFNYPMYWMAPGLGAFGAAGAFPPPEAGAPRDAEPHQPADDEQHVRSISEVRGYHVAAADGEIGHVDDVLIDLRTWSLRCLLLDTSNWIGGRAVLVPADRVTEIEWARRLVHVGLTRDAVRSGPDYRSGAAVDEGCGVHLETVRDPIRPI
jgi:sporulation protein YlmC with PRC-barrel domain